MLWYVKTKRAQTNMDDEGWQEGGVSPTLNAFDMGDTRATVIVFHPHRSDGVRLQGDTINTLTAFMGTGGLNTPMVSTDSVRRLTPVECERLQGFPDDWTAQRYDFKKDKVVEQADSSRYKQMGNAVAVPVVDWIIGRLVEADVDDQRQA